MDGAYQLSISRVLGSVMKHTKRPGFGPLGTLHAQHQLLAQRPRSGEQISFAPSEVKRIVRAFEETRLGYAVDRVLADPDLAAKFFERCRQLEINAPDHAIALRLFRFRKSPSKGTRIQRATATRENRDFSPYIFAAEMAATQMKYLYGASVDDILAYPEIGKEFDTLAKKLRPGWKSVDYRLAALHVRKSQYFDEQKNELTLFGKIRDKLPDNMAEFFGPLSDLDPKKISNTEGIIGLLEKADSPRFLYIGKANRVAQAVRPFTREDAFDPLANAFWSPSLSLIHLVVYDIHEDYLDATPAVWTKKLIHDNSPVFNIPVRLAEAA